MTADKFYSDEFLRNDDYALVGGIEREINELEAEILDMIGFQLLISSEEYAIYRNKLDLFAAQIKLKSTDLHNEDKEIKKEMTALLK